MEKQTPLVSVVSPVYQAEPLVEALVERTKEALRKITERFEIILVEDGSRDNSWQAIQQEAKQDQRVKGIKLSRNYGQHPAITAGLDGAQGEWIVVMDCDLQDRPEEIVPLYYKAQEGYDIVLARRHQRKDTFLKKTFSWLFYRLLAYLTGTKYDAGVANFGIYHHKVINAVVQMRESVRYFPIMVQWVGFRQTKLDVQHAARQEGKTTYNFKRMMDLAIDIILAYSDKPLRLTIRMGLLIALSALGFAIYNIILYYRGVMQVPGYTSLIVSIWLLSGLMIAILGVVGLYIGKTFEGVKNRPIYIVSQKTQD
ncbi:glycosyltransferase [marine bacterium AO1-C]|nr:glycosyltransferase [marine bacterium AO1-C]